MGGLVSRVFSVVYYFTELFIQFIEEMVLHDLRKNSCHEVYVYPRKEENTCHGDDFCCFDNPSRSSSNVNISSSLDCPTMFQRGYNGLSLSPHSAALLRCWLCNVVSVYHGLCLVPLLSLAYTWQLASSFLRCLSLCIRSLQNDVRSLVFRLQLSLDGSSKDIGWLLRETGLPSTRDHTSRFTELLLRIRSGEQTRLSNSFIYLLIPGLFSNHSPLYFVNTKRYFSKMGLACHIAKIHSEASVEQNAWELKMYIEELYWGSGKQVLLLGHSKGGVDAAASLSIYWPSLRDKVAGLALVQSPYGGTPIASDILREGQVADLETFRVLEIIMKKIIKGDMQALEDLTYDKRKEFLNKYSIPKELPVVSFHTKANTGPWAILRMTQIANTKLPYFPLPLFNDTSSCSKELPVVIPLAACMALCAIHIQLRYGEDSDGLVTRKDAEVPGSVVVRLQEKLDHAWMVYSSWKKDHTEPDACEMCEALFSLLLEVAGESNANW